MDLIEEAKKRGYIAGTEIKYITKSDDIDVLGRGEFEINNGRLLKYEYPKQERDCFDRSAYDVIYNPDDGWTLISGNQ